jgi:hypothetical protein
MAAAIGMLRESHDRLACGRSAGACPPF